MTTQNGAFRDLLPGRQIDLQSHDTTGHGSGSMLSTGPHIVGGENDSGAISCASGEGSAKDCSGPPEKNPQIIEEKKGR